ncbi:MAG: helix-turn-helix domain-containing protein [Patescibacteria group bacterium]|nr:helix-turn-helix domain-containing protein [Patescibacteria group bacterium]
MQAENTDILDAFKWRLNRAAEKLDLNQAEVAVRLGVSPQRVGNWFQGRNFPSQRQSISLAKLLGISTEWLLQGEGEPDSASVAEAAAEYGGSPVRAIPLVSWAHAGTAATYEEIPKDSRATVSSMSRDKRAFALTIEGDSMEPKFLAGDRVVCEPSRQPVTGKPVIAKFSDDAVQLRIYQKMPSGKIRLAPLNPVYAATEHKLSEFSWIFPVSELSRPIY